MRDIDIRKPLLAALAKEHLHDSNTRVIEEFGLCQGSARVDVAVINGSIHGYEIKSERDTLYRLPRQQNIYNKVLDSITLVVSNKHLKKAEKEVPIWWGLCEAQHIEDNVSIQIIRPPKKNKNIDPSALVQLLWRDEALGILTARNLQKGVVSKSREIIWDRILDNLSLDELRSEVRSHVKARQHWRPVSQ